MSKNKILVYLFVFVFIGFFLLCLFKPADEFSDSERRYLKVMPELTLETILSGDFMEEFEIYSADQFPFREAYRQLKGFASANIFKQKENNGYFKAEGHLSKLEYPLNEKSVNRALQRFQYVYEKYMAKNESNVYICVIPDKNYYLAKKNGYLSMDYEKLFFMVKENAAYMEYIDITDCLSSGDYYRTDPHWRQEEIVDVAVKLGEALGITLSGEYEMKRLDKPFYGTYYGQAALKAKPDVIKYLTNEVLEGCKVYDYENDKETDFYDMEKAEGKDPYEMYLSGPLSIVTIENPFLLENENVDDYGKKEKSEDKKKELIIFRDSFGSSIAPLLAEGYEKITLVDIRYIHPEMLERYVEFENRDVLFLYSTSVLNHSETMK